MDWMLNRLCPKLTPANSIRSNSYPFDHELFDRNPSLSTPQCLKSESNADDISSGHGGGKQSNLYFRQQSTLVEESIHAMDTGAVHSVIVGSPDDAEFSNGEILVESEMEELYNKISCQNLSSSIYLDKEFRIPLKLDTSNEVPRYPYQYEQMYYQSGAQEG